MADGRLCKLDSELTEKMCHRSYWQLSVNADAPTWCPCKSGAWRAAQRDRVEMDDIYWVVLLCIFMFVGSFAAGSIPLAMQVRFCVGP